MSKKIKLCVIPILICALLFTSCSKESVVTEAPVESPYGIGWKTSDNGYGTAYVDNYIFTTVFDAKDYEFDNYLDFEWRALPSAYTNRLGSTDEFLSNCNFSTGASTTVKSDIAAKTQIRVISEMGNLVGAPNGNSVAYSFIRALTIKGQLKRTNDKIIWSDQRWIEPLNGNYTWTLQSDENEQFNYYYIFWYEDYLSCVVSGDVALECIRRSLLGEDPLTFINTLISDYDEEYETKTSIFNLVTGEELEYVDYDIT